MARSAAALKSVEPDSTDTVDNELGKLIDQLEMNRRARRPIEAKLKPLEDEATSLKAKIMALMDQAGTQKSGTKMATVSVSEIERVVIKDAEKMITALKKQGWLHILDLKVVASKEYLERTGKEIPGTVTEVVRRQLNHTSLR